MTHRTEDSSVMFALDELRRLETERVAEERAAEERRRREAAAAEAEARREVEEREQHERRVAEAEARLRMEQELRARDAEAEHRLARLRAELEAVRADRERIHATVTRLNEEPVTPSPRRPSGWAFAFAATALVAAGLVFALVSRPPVPEQRIVQAPATAPDTVAVEEEPADTAPEEPEPSDEPAPDSTDAPEEPAQVATGPSRPHGQGNRPVVGGRPPATDADDMDSALDFSHCGDDPTCGLEDDF